MSRLRVALPPGTYVLAVSGGIDSMALLDVCVRYLTNEQQLIVAHVDHGMRPDSGVDAQFVKQSAEKYGLPFFVKKVALGEGASEAVAREARYAFLQQLAQAKQASIVTAHHADDVIETMAINYQRGTGWRGMAALRSETVVRPFLHYWKAELLAYALDHSLTWREDATNQQPMYLRNRLRQKFAQAPLVAKQQLLQLHNEQVDKKGAIDDEAERLLRVYGNDRQYLRYPFIMVEEEVAIELLGGVFRRHLGHSLPRPQLARALMAVKTFKPRRLYAIDAQWQLVFQSTTFIVQCVQA